MRVLLVTSWDEPCGIAEHAFYLKQAVEASDPSITITPNSAWLDPYRLLYDTDWTKQPLPIVHLDYQASLLSRWGVDQIAKVQALGGKVVVTFHDTGVPNSDLCRSICAAADAFVVHEPYDDLDGNGYYWRMGVPELRGTPTVFGVRETDRITAAWRPTPQNNDIMFLRYQGQPILGSIGFPFPWKNFDLLARLTAELGWALLLITPGATAEQVDQWRTLNPDSWIRTDFVPRREVLALLSACDATAFPYVCHNTGQSAAILQGIAARKPVLAFETCRQFRALALDSFAQRALRWADSTEKLGAALLSFPRDKADPGIVALAARESWTKVGERYAWLYRSLVEGGSR